MVPQRPEGGFIHMSEHEFEVILVRAMPCPWLASTGWKPRLPSATCAPCLRFRAWCHAIFQAVVRLITTGLLLALIAGAAVELKVFG